MNRETLIKATRIAIGIILAAFVIVIVLKVFVASPSAFYPFYLTLFNPMNNATLTQAPVWQIAFYEGNYLWSNRVIDTMSLAVVFVATGLGAAILLRAEPEEKETEEEKGAEH
ncbi:MAG: hypothetical protein WED07_11630 [Candidatus Freyarchaeum deiterrae]